MGSLGAGPFQKTLKTTLKWRAVPLAAVLVSSFALPVFLEEELGRIRTYRHGGARHHAQVHLR